MRFYKYFTPEASTAVLGNGTLKWSSPRLFNDPFEFPTAMDFSFKGEVIAEALMDELVRLAYDPDEPKGNPKNQFIVLSNMARRNPNKRSAEEFRRFMAPATKESMVRFEQGLAERREFLRRFRDEFAVLCLSEKNDDLLMWAHYAKNHTGCVLQLRCLPGYDRPICAAKKVNYVPTYPLIATLDGYVKHLTGQSELDYDILFEIFAFTKSLHWKYEAEWRCVSQLRDRGAGFDYDPLIPDQLEAIYIGSRATEEYRNTLLAEVQSRYSETKVYQASVDIQSYTMCFEKIR